VVVNFSIVFSGLQVGQVRLKYEVSSMLVVKVMWK
jgi:hypothetical protein